MEDYLEKILEFLPETFFDKDSDDFIKYLSDAFIENSTNEKYQFAFTAFHMLNMVFIYKTKWFLFKQGNTIICTALENFRNNKNNNIDEFNTLFDLSLFNEKKSLEEVLKSLKFHVNEIGISRNHVDVRNNCSHASGRIYYDSQKKIEHFIEEELLVIERIHVKTLEMMESLINKFINEKWNNTFILQDIKILFNENYFSKKDLLSILNFQYSFLSLKSNTSEVFYKKILYLLIVNEIQIRVNSDENFFLQKLHFLMNNISENIIVKKEVDELEISTLEIIEEHISPIISTFFNEEREKAEEILYSNC